MGRPKKTQEPHIVITLTIPEVYEARIQKLIDLGVEKSRSGTVRHAVGEFLEREFKTNLFLLKGDIK